MPFQTNVDIIGLRTHLTSGMDTAIMGAWEVFLTTNIKDQIPERLSDDVHCVYTNYTGDHTKPMDMILGFAVPTNTRSDTPPSHGLYRVEIPATFTEKTCAKYLSTGTLPDVLIETWQTIWKTHDDRAFTLDIDYYLASTPTTVETYIALSPAT